LAELRDWRDLDGRRDTLQDAAHALADGQLVAFPVETGYVIAACTLLPAAVQRLAEWPRREGDAPASLLLPWPAALIDFAPTLGRLGRRLSQRCWPGPIQFVVDASHPQRAGSQGSGLTARLAPSVRRFLGAEQTIGARVPAHEAIRQTSMLLPGFLAVVAMEGENGASGVDSAELQSRYGDRLALIVDDDPRQCAKPASVVRLLDEGWQLLREGAVPAAMLEELSACMIVFVCTGNTCRSPLAEALCKKQLADRLGCMVEELPRRGFVVRSAGLSAATGCSAAEGAVAIGRSYGVDLAGHVTRPATAALLRQADHVFAMTQSHLRTIRASLPGAASWVKLISPSGDDLPDPIGGDEGIYQQCADKIWQCVTARLADIE
jgi:protein-tyrosine phosphatase